MTARAAVPLAALALTLALGCRSAEPAPPAAVVDRYFRFLARDPIRTLPLLTPAFHEQHGLHVVTTAEARRWQEELRSGAAPAPPPAAEERFAVDRLQLAWLAVQAREPFRALRDRLAWSRLGEGLEGDRAWVRVRVQAGDEPPFEQRFALVRTGPGAAWRIDAVEQGGVARGNRAAAFVAHPSEATRRELERELRASPR